MSDVSPVPEVTAETPLLAEQLINLLMRRQGEFVERARNREPSPEEIEAAGERLSITETAYEESYPELPETVAGLMEWLRDRQAEVPKRYRAGARIEFDTSCDRFVVRLTYHRPESQQEWDDRRADIARRQALWAERREIAEREEFDRLKAKFAT